MVKDKIERFVSVCDQIIQETLNQQTIWESAGLAFQAKAAGVLRTQIQKILAEAVDGTLWQPVEQWRADGDNRAAWAAKLHDELLVFREEAVNGQLRRPSNHMGWGLGRAVGEWAARTQMYKAVSRMETFYVEEM